MDRDNAHTQGPIASTEEEAATFHDLIAEAYDWNEREHRAAGKRKRALTCKRMANRERARARKLRQKKGGRK